MVGNRSPVGAEGPQQGREVGRLGHVPVARRLLWRAGALGPSRLGDVEGWNRCRRRWRLGSEGRRSHDLGDGRCDRGHYSLGGRERWLHPSRRNLKRDGRAGGEVHGRPRRHPLRALDLGVGPRSARLGRRDGEGRGPGRLCHLFRPLRLLLRLRLARLSPASLRLGLFGAALGLVGLGGCSGPPARRSRCCWGSAVRIGRRRGGLVAPRRRGRAARRTPALAVLAVLLRRLLGLVFRVAQLRDQGAGALFPAALLAPSRLLLELLLEIELPLLSIIVLDAGSKVSVWQFLGDLAPLLGGVKIGLFELFGFLLGEVDVPRHHLPRRDELLHGEQPGRVVEGRLLLLLLGPKHVGNDGLLVAAVLFLLRPLLPLLFLLVLAHRLLDRVVEVQFGREAACRPPAPFRLGVRTRRSAVCSRLRARARKVVPILDGGWVIRERESQVVLVFIGVFAPQFLLREPRGRVPFSEVGEQELTKPFWLFLEIADPSASIPRLHVVHREDLGGRRGRELPNGLDTSVDARVVVCPVLALVFRRPGAPFRLWLVRWPRGEGGSLAVGGHCVHRRRPARRWGWRRRLLLWLWLRLRRRRRDDLRLRDVLHLNVLTQRFRFLDSRHWWQLRVFRFCVFDLRLGLLRLSCAVTGPFHRGDDRRLSGRRGGLLLVLVLMRFRVGHLLVRYLSARLGAGEREALGNRPDHGHQVRAVVEHAEHGFVYRCRVASDDAHGDLANRIFEFLELGLRLGDLLFKVDVDILVIIRFGSLVRKRRRRLPDRQLDTGERHRENCVSLVDSRGFVGRLVGILRPLHGSALRFRGGRGCGVTLCVLVLLSGLLP